MQRILEDGTRPTQEYMDQDPFLGIFLNLNVILRELRSSWSNSKSRVSNESQTSLLSVFVKVACAR